ncbi:hypothetical protein JCM10450v2_002058 [Rhodotorula kratochvilovae]
MPDAAFDWAPQADPLLSQEAFSPAPLLSSRGPLHPGSTWAGVQRSGRNSYEVTVKIDTVDLTDGRVNGTLEIKGLTPELDSLVTFFEGEIVGEVGGPGFRTGQYGATEIDDLKHWRRFPAFTRNRLEQQLVKPGLHLRNAHGRPYVFMRWKEQFVTSHRVEAIHGASYAGFYYCCLDCDPSPFSTDSGAHRGISPATPRASPAPPRARRTPSYGHTEPGLLSQTRPTPSRAPSVGNMPPPTVNLPSPAATPVTMERPAPPRRGSSGFSYAAALRGDAPVDVPMSTSPSSSSSSSSPPSSGSPLTPPSQPTTSTSAFPDLPTPKSELDPTLSSLASPDAPSSPPGHLPPLWQAVANAPLSPHLPSLASLAPPPADDAEWPAPVPASSPAARPSGALRRMSSDVATVLAKARGRGRPGNARRKSVVQEPAEGEFDDRGLRSWTDATISGFYFHHSASPYQELSLRYVPATQGGSADFSFR